MALTQYKIPEKSYPRFKYQRDRLSSITQRLENLIKPGNLAECISQGTVKLKGIRQLTECLKGDVKVTVSTTLKTPSQLLDQLQLYKDPDSKVECTTVTTTSVFESLKSSIKFKPDFIVFHMQTISLQSSTPLISQIQLLDKSLLENIIVHGADSDCSYSLRELQDNNFDVKQIKHTARYKSVGRQIQYMLEDRIAEVLENIAEFVKVFCPKEGEEITETIDRECSNQVLESFRSPPVMDDLNPELILRQEESFKTGGERRQFTDAELDAEFHRQLLHFLSQKTKVVICDYLSKKYGISASLVNEFMNEGFFDYDKKYREEISKQRLASWASMKQGRQAVMIGYSCVTTQASFFQKVEDYIKRVLKHLRSLEKLNFEVYSLLRRMEVPVCVNIPKYPSVPAKLQEDLLSLSNVVGCGTIYGKLGIHVKDSINLELKSDIKEILDKHNYSHGYKIQRMESFERHAGCTHGEEMLEIIESGDQLQCALTPEGLEKIIKNDKEGKMVGKDKFGTLGCFIGLRKAPSPEAMEVEGAVGGPEDTKLYGITCAHCVTDCHPSVNVHCPTTNAFKSELGDRELVLDNQDQIDIAAVQVKQACVINCSFSISLQQQWQFYTGGAGDDSLAGQDVWKKGAVTDTTQGIVISNDYRRYSRDDIIIRGNQHGFNLDASYTILIDDIQGVDPLPPVFALEQEPAAEHVFSKRGDSGSVVFYNKPSNEGNRIMVLSLLEGSIRIGEQPPFSYSCHLKSSLDELCRLNGREIVMPWEVI